MGLLFIFGLKPRPFTYLLEDLHDGTGYVKTPFTAYRDNDSPSSSFHTFPKGAEELCVYLRLYWSIINQRRRAENQKWGTCTVCV